MMHIRQVMPRRSFLGTDVDSAGTAETGQIPKLDADKNMTLLYV